MTVTLTALSTPGDLTFATLKQYAKDQLQDRTDAKGVRRAGRIVNQAARRVAGEKLWGWHLRRFRIVLRPKQYYSQVSASALGNTLTLLSGSWRDDAAQWSWIFSGDTEILRIRSRDSSTQLTTFSNDLYVASSDVSGVPGHLIRNRYQMDANFRCIAEDIHQKDYFGADGEISRAEMLHLNQTFTPSDGSPINYVLEMNPISRRWEFMVWQWPSELRSADLYHYVWPQAMENDSDVLDWDPNQSDVIYKAINLTAIEETRAWSEWPAANKAYQDALRVAKSSDRKSLAPRVAGRSTTRTKRMALNRLFTNA